MATPLTADRVVELFRAEGLTVVEVGSWRTHNRNHKGKWGPVNGVMIHHTASQGTEGSVRLCYDGRENLPGPLCHAVIDKKGVVHMVGWGRTNHAGLGDGRVMQAVVNEGVLPVDKAADTDGNARFYGFECINLGNGKDPWPQVQLDAMIKASAVLVRAHGWGTAGSTSVIGHKEWQPGKPDPAGIDMGWFRGEVAKRVAAGRKAR